MSINEAKGLEGLTIDQAKAYLDKYGQISAVYNYRGRGDKMSKTNRTIEVLRADVVGASFYSASAFCREHGLGRRFRAMIIGQPGYRVGTEMAIAKAKTGGYRLYGRVIGQWMDASLQDLSL